MARVPVNGVSLYYEQSERGEIPLVLVHGSWVSGDSWAPVVPRLAESFQVVSYDRRGHSRSATPAGQGSVHEDVADLAGLIETLQLPPAWVVANSFGGNIALRLAVAHPELVRGVIAHEPAAFGLLADDSQLRPTLEETGRRIRAVVDRIAREDPAGAAEQFTETVALGPGSWQQLGAAKQQVMIQNAPTFLDESQEPEALDLDLASLATCTRPCLLTLGDQSPPTFAPIVKKLAAVVPQSRTRDFRGSGHIPHVTDSDAFVATVAEFVGEHTTHFARTMPIA